MSADESMQKKSFWQLFSAGKGKQEGPAIQGPKALSAGHSNTLCETAVQLSLQ